MKVVQCSRLACLLVLLGLAAAPASAQQPTPTPTDASNPSGFPLEAPQGWDQHLWDHLRTDCNHIVEEARTHKPLQPGEFQESQSCTSMSVELMNAHAAPAAGAYQSPERPTPSASPSPVESPQSQNTAPSGQLSTASLVGPAGVSFSGGGENSCAAGQSQPPDVAAGVSATQAVELLNNVGLFIYDKQGNQLDTETLPNFWFTNSPPSGSNLTDTQVAFEPSAQRWLVATLDDTAAKDNGDLYFAFTQSSDATAGWTFYKFQNICSSINPETNPLPDQPILGFNQAWIAIDLQCFPAGGVGGFVDQLVLIPHSLLTLGTPPTSLACGQPIAPNGPSVLCETPPFGGARPSRDVSADGTKNLFLVQSLVPMEQEFPPRKWKLLRLTTAATLWGPARVGEYS